jgi:hypothetical protein
MAGNGAGANKTDARGGKVALVMAWLNRVRKIPKGPDAMDLELSNFQPAAASEVVEQEVLDPGGDQVTPGAPLLASLIRQVGMASITHIDQLIDELEDARNYLKSEEERIQAETARYTALTQAASASVKVIFDTLREWRKDGHSVRAAEFGFRDAVEETSDWLDSRGGTSRSPE